MTIPLLSFFGDPSLKAAVRHRVAEHRRLDQKTDLTPVLLNDLINSRRAGMKA